MFGKEDDIYKLNVEDLEKLLTGKGDREVTHDDIVKIHTALRDIDEDGREKGFGDKIEGVVRTLKDIWGVVKQFNDPWAKIDHAASQFSKAIGQSAKQYEALRKTTIDNVRQNNISIKYNMSTEELIQAQQNYALGAGRNIAVSKEDQENLAAITAVYGDKATELSVMFEKFGVGLTDSSEHMGDMFNKAAKSGLSLQKYTDNVKKGLALAQTYTFAGGLKSMERMAQHAAKIHMDMEQVRALADKTGNVEGAITTAAKMQVLGGPFTSMADPLGMLSESWGDMEGLADRMSKITASMGRFNRATGEVNVDAFNRQRLRAYAEATGQDYNSVMETVQHQTKLGEIKSQISASAAAGLSDEMKELIENTATFKDGRAGVTIDGKFKSLNDLSEGDKEKLQALQQTEAQDIKQIAQDLASLVDRRKGFEKQLENMQATVSEWWVGPFEKMMTTKFGKITAGILTTATAFLSVRKIGKLFGKLFTHGKNLSGAGGKVVGETGPSARGISKITKKVFKPVRNVTAGLLKHGNVRDIARTGLKFGKGAGVGLGLGLAGHYVDKLTDKAVESGKIKKYGFAHSAGKIASSAAKWGAWGGGNPYATAALATVGAIVGATKLAKEKRTDALDNKLTQMGIERKGDYGAYKLKKINKALNTGKISNRNRRRLELEGDFEMLAQIDAVKKQRKDGKRQWKLEKAKARHGGDAIKRIKQATFHVDVANFTGKAFGGVSILSAPKESLAGGMKINSFKYQSTKKANEENNTIKPIDININGTLKLEGNNGQSVDIISLLKKDDTLKRALAKLLASEVERTINNRKVGGASASRQQSYGDNAR